MLHWHLIILNPHKITSYIFHRVVYFTIVFARILRKIVRVILKKEGFVSKIWCTYLHLNWVGRFCPKICLIDNLTEILTLIFRRPAIIHRYVVLWRLDRIQSPLNRTLILIIYQYFPWMNFLADSGVLLNADSRHPEPLWLLRAYLLQPQGIRAPLMFDMKRGHWKWFHGARIHLPFQRRNSLTLAGIFRNNRLARSFPSYTCRWWDDSSGICWFWELIVEEGAVIFKEVVLTVRQVQVLEELKFRLLLH